MWSACVIKVLMEEGEAIHRLMDADQLLNEEPVHIYIYLSARPQAWCRTNNLMISVRRQVYSP